VTLTLYSQPGCHLCDDMKIVIHRVMESAQTPIALEEIDITTDADLLERYGAEIPVLLVDGKKAAKYRITDAELRKILEGRGENG
jgi:thiol-disulfide isomerase/thioredoxin